MLPGSSISSNLTLVSVVQVLKTQCFYLVIKPSDLELEKTSRIANLALNPDPSVRPSFTHSLPRISAAGKRFFLNTFFIPFYALRLSPNTSSCSDSEPR